ncbi:penicillin-binding protein [Treponema parvum]|nr:penicillin-binding protein [Treponema parvum]
MEMNDFFKKTRLWISASAALIFMAVIIVQYARIALTPAQKITVRQVSSERGSIVDRNGKPLAVQTNFYHVGVTPSSVKNTEKLAHDCALVLGMDETEILNKINGAENSPFIYIKKKISQNTYDELSTLINEKGYTGIRFDRIPGRAYPENALASQLIGYMGDDGSGLAGIEYSRQNVLSPVQKPGEAAVHGNNIYLTIDANLQYKLEKIARNTMETTQAANMMLIAAQAKTGEILSYISLPSVNLNEYATASREETIDRPAMTAYEPGSVFKIFTVASALDAGAISTNEIFVCDGIYEKKLPYGGHIRITCLGRHGPVTAREALQYSCNDALAQIAEKMNTDNFLGRLRLMGFGSRTGIELPGETAGSVKSPNDKLWSARSKPTMAIGQEISVSALQMVQAATGIANEGIPVNLTVIHKITDNEGNIVFEHTPVYKDRTFGKAAADYVLSCMETTAEAGTGSRARLGDISIGVKTGTAQMADTVHGGYSTTDFLSNCLAIFPIEDPEIILYIVIEKAKGETYAGRIVAPVIAEAADTIIDHLGISRGNAASLAHSGRVSIKDTSPAVLGTTLPDFKGMSKRDLIPILERKDLQVRISGTGWVVSQEPPPGTPVTQGMNIELTLE